VRLTFPNSDGNRVLFFGPSGYMVRFERNAAGDYIRYAPGLNASLRYDSTVLGYRLDWFDKSMYVFDTSGQLTSMRDKQGNHINFYYIGDQLSFATDTTGHRRLRPYAPRCGTTCTWARALAGSTEGLQGALRPGAYVATVDRLWTTILTNQPRWC